MTLLSDESYQRCQKHLKRIDGLWVLTPAYIEAIRAHVKMSQAVFARSFQLSLDTIKGWEQSKRKPDAAATNYLRLIQADPDRVQKILAG